MGIVLVGSMETPIEDVKHRESLELRHMCNAIHILSPAVHPSQEKLQRRVTRAPEPEVTSISASQGAFAALQAHWQHHIDGVGI